jgi:drug/metabolite transporter (DMT)-like permease
MRLAGRALRRATNSNDSLVRADWPLLGAITVIGGAVGPVLLLVGLQRVSGVAGSLLLNLEAVATMVLAVTVFGDSLNRREACGAALVIVGAVVLSYEPGQVRAEIPGVALIAAACTCWGLDNNLTARVSRRNPVQITYIKALGAGTGNLALALAAGRSMPPVRVTAVALAIGFVCYGVSIVLDVYALRYIGPAREAAFFATAPFAGAIASVPLLGEVPSAHQLIAAAVMAVGVVTVTGLRALRPD